MPVIFRKSNSQNYPYQDSTPNYYGQTPYSDRRLGSAIKGRLIIALIFVAISLLSYFSSSQVNPVTGEKQRVALDEKQEVAMGLQAAPEMAAQHGGLAPDPAGQARVDKVGHALLSILASELMAQGKEIPYPFDFHLLADARVVNAFALPGGQIFITNALYRQLSSDSQLAAVLGHEIGHVLSRHGAQQLAKGQLTAGLSQAAQIAGGSHESGQLAMMIGQLVNMKYGRTHELEADKWGVKLLVKSGQDPRAMIDLMEILERASGGGGPPEFLSTHPKPGNRVEYIEQVIEEVKKEE